MLVILVHRSHSYKNELTLINKRVKTIGIILALLGKNQLK
jgi:hypothetical protein